MRKLLVLAALFLAAYLYAMFVLTPNPNKYEEDFELFV